MATTTPLYQQPDVLLRNLIRFDTTNPPGNEAACIAYIRDVLNEAGIESLVLEKAPGRPNLIARLPGSGQAPPLLLQGHVDVVTTSGQQWQQPPFEARVVDGYIWGRGALDMKGAVAMMVSSVLRAKAEGVALPGDVILCVLSDEEAGGELGARFLVEAHPEQFEGVRYALGEFGGFPLYIAGKRFYPIMVAEKQISWMKATLRGPAGHGSRPLRGGVTAAAKLARLLSTLDSQRLPAHVTPVARLMVEAIAQRLPDEVAQPMLGLLDPDRTDMILDAAGDALAAFDPLLHNTVSPNIIRGGEKINVIPAEITVEMDGRLLPGYTPDDMARELVAVIGGDAELEVIRFESGPPEPDMHLFDTLGDILREGDPDAIPVPYLLGGVTDARHFAQLGIQTYGFTPLTLPEDFNFSSTVHAADERVTVDGVRFGTEAMFKALQRFG
ncbi:MAG: M20/M25/M40 family metallo-hydrolase [Chloroflexota bacterium]